MRAHHHLVLPVLNTLIATSATVAAISLVVDVVTGQVPVQDGAAVVAMVAMFLLTRSLFPRRLPRQQRRVAKALYFEAERLISAMTPERPYRADDVVFLRTPPARFEPCRVLRVELGELDLPGVDTAGLAMVQQFSLTLQVPRVHHGFSGHHVDLGPDGHLIVRDDDVVVGLRQRCRNAAREVRLMRTSGANLASVEELRTLVEQLRVAEPMRH